MIHFVIQEVVTMPNASPHNNKDEMITARCDAHTKAILLLLSKSERLSMSDVIAKSVLEYHQKHFPTQSFLKEEQMLFGRHSSNKGDLSVERKHYLRELLGGKHSHS